MMRISATTTPLANGRDALAMLKSKARSLRDTSLPFVASSAGSKAISRAFANSLRSEQGGKRGILASGVALLQAAPALRMAGRFALRNPALLAAAGVVIVIIGHSAWKRSQSETHSADADSAVAPAE